MEFANNIGLLCICTVGFIVVISYVLLATGLIGTVRVARTNIPPESRSTIRIPLFLSVAGAFGILALLVFCVVSAFLTQRETAQSSKDFAEVACFRIPLTDEFHLAASSSRNGTERGDIVASESGERIFLLVTKYAIVDRYMIGVEYSQDSTFFWFDLTTGGYRRFDHEDHDKFVRSLHALGIPEEPSYLSPTEHCSIVSCQPCASSTPSR